MLKVIGPTNIDKVMIGTSAQGGTWRESKAVSRRPGGHCSFCRRHPGLRITSPSPRLGYRRQLRHPSFRYRLAQTGSTKSPDNRGTKKRARVAPRTIITTDPFRTQVCFFYPSTTLTHTHNTHTLSLSCVCFCSHRQSISSQSDLTLNPLLLQSLTRLNHPLFFLRSCYCYSKPSTRPTKPFFSSPQTAS